MEIREINDKSTWENFLLGCEEKTFLQAWNWGEFNKLMGYKIWRFDGALVIKVEAKRGTFLFIPHLPSTGGQFPIFVDCLKKLAKKEDCSFIRIAPLLERNAENKKIFSDLGFKDSPIHMHPEVTWELDISKSEEDILLGMRKTTRYLIRQAEKNQDIKIEQSSNADDLNEFQKLYDKTIERHHFVGFPPGYLKNEFLAFAPDKQISIFLGKYKGELLSSAIVIFWHDIAFYHHGASLQSKIPVSYLLQWEVIGEAKRRGCKTYNMWGIAPDGSPKHPWVGLTLFKMGFGGYKKEYLKTQDLSLSAKYWLTYILEKIRKAKRGL